MPSIEILTLRRFHTPPASFEIADNVRTLSTGHLVEKLIIIPMIPDYLNQLEEFCSQQWLGESCLGFRPITSDSRYSTYAVYQRRTGGPR